MAASRRCCSIRSTLAGLYMQRAAQAQAEATGGQAGEITGLA
jgi:hypothetical protein